MATGSSATISGGDNNKAGDAATIGGGQSNEATGGASAIAGGREHIASAIYSSVGSGLRNYATGNFANVPGGLNNQAAGANSFAAGRRAKANHNGAFVWADSNDADFASTVDNQFNVRATGGARIVSAIDGSGNPTAGVQLSPGGGAWSSLSDRNAKANVALVDGLAMLRQLATIPIQTWNYRSQDSSIRHIGPMAQDFAATFGVGENDTHISTVDADGVALAAIQGLHSLVQQQDTQLATQQERIVALEAQNTALEERLATLERAIQNDSSAQSLVESYTPNNWGSVLLVLVVLCAAFLRRPLRSRSKQ